MNNTENKTTVMGKTIIFKSVPSKLKALGSRIASISKNATRKMSNWYATHISDRKFDSMSIENQKKVLEKFKNYNENKLDNYANDEAESKLKKQFEYQKNTDEYNANVNRINGMQNKIDTTDMEENKIKELESKISELQKRNDDIVKEAEAQKEEIKSKIIEDNKSRYDELFSKHENKIADEEYIDADDDLNENVSDDINIDRLNKKIDELAENTVRQAKKGIKSNDNKKNVTNMLNLSNVDEIEKSIGIRITDKTEEISSKLGGIYSKNLDVLLANFKKEMEKSFNSILEAAIKIEMKENNKLLKVASDKITDLSSKNAELTKKLTEVSTNFENGINKNNSLIHEKKQLEEENTLLVQQKENLSSEKEKIELALEQEKKQNADYKTEINMLKSKIQSIESNNSIEIEKTRDNYEKVIKQLKDKIKYSASILSDNDYSNDKEKVVKSDTKNKIDRLNETKQVISDLSKTYVDAPSYSDEFDLSQFDLSNLFDNSTEVASSKRK